jgi:O-antigen/teichoic acid export membrane protein
MAEVEKVVSNVFTFRTSLALVIYLLAFLIGLVFPYPMIVKFGIGIAATNMLWLTLNQTLVGVFQANMRIDKAVLTDIIGRLIILVTVLYFIHIHAGLLLILAGYSIGSFINLIISFWLSRSFVKIVPSYDLKIWRKIFIAAWPMGVITILGMIYFKMDSVILSLYKSSDDVGIYGAPFKILEILMALPSMFMGAAFPVLSAYIATKDRRLPSALQKAFDFMIITSLPLVVTGFILAKKIMTFIVGANFADSFKVTFHNFNITTSATLQILLFAVGISFISSLFGYLVIAMGKQKYLIWPNVVCVFFNIGFNILFIPRFSYLASAVISVLTQILITILSGKVALGLIKINPQLKIIGKVFLASAIMGLIIYFLSFLNLFILLILAFVIYFGLLYLIGGISKNTIASIIRRA